VNRLVNSAHSLTAQFSRDPPYFRFQCRDKFCYDYNVNDLPEKVTVAEAARLIELPDATIRSWIRRGYIGSYKDGHNRLVRLDQVIHRLVVDGLRGDFRRNL